MSRSQKFMLPVLLMIPWSSVVLAASQVSEDETFSQVYSVPAGTPTLNISNIWGDVVIRPGQEGQIRVTARVVRTAPSQARLEKSRELLKIRDQLEGNELVVYVGDEYRDWRRSNQCRGCRLFAQFEVFAPPGTTIEARTVNDGEVNISGMNGLVNASNVNGDISIEGLAGCEEVSNVNGRIDLLFATGPSLACAIETINGDIRLALPGSGGLDAALNLFNGRVFSDFPVNGLAMAASVSHEMYDGQNRYVIEQPAGLRIGNGGPVFSLSSMNGDIRFQSNP